MRLYTLLLLTIISLTAFISTSHAQSIFSGLTLSERKDGLTVIDIQKGSPGFDAGLRIGDVVLEIDGKRVKRLNDYVNISRKAKGKRVEISLVIHRNDESYEATIKVYSIPIFQHWKEKATKPVALPRGLTESPYEYWISKGNRTLKEITKRTPFDAKVKIHNVALKFLLNGLHYKPESIDTALQIASLHHKLGILQATGGNIKEGVVNYRKAIRFYSGCHQKTENEKHLNIILTSLQKIEEELSMVNIKG